MNIPDLTKSSVLPHWDLACEHLKAADPRFIPLIRMYPQDRLSGSGDGFRTLANAIVGQQISIKAAESIWTRLMALTGGMTPGRILAQSREDLRAAGLSQRKVEYFYALAEAFHQEVINPRAWPHQSDEEILQALVGLRGIGRWTAQMFLIFHLHRPDVLPVDDIGLQKSAARFFGRDDRLTPGELMVLTEGWRPWRTVGTWYLWRNLDPLPVVY